MIYEKYFKMHLVVLKEDECKKKGIIESFLRNYLYFRERLLQVRVVLYVLI